MAKRPYIRMGIIELEEVFNKNSDVDTLSDLDCELNHRKTKRAKTLKSCVEDRIKQIKSNNVETIAKSREEKETLQKIPNPQKQRKAEPSKKEPPTYKKIESEEAKKHKNTVAKILASNDEILDNFIDALQCEVESIRSSSRERSINLYNGILTESSIDSFIYRFPIDAELYVRDDVPIQVIVSEIEASGNVVSICDKEIFISVDQNMGKRIASASLIIDDSFLVERLKEQYIKIRDKNPDVKINTKMMYKSLGNDSITTNETEISSELIDHLTDSQKKPLAKQWGAMFLSFGGHLELVRRW